VALRLKTRFRTRGPKTLEQRASVVAANAWRLAQDTCRRMEKEGYPLGSDAQVAALMAEMMAFMVQAADRLVYGKISEEDRARFINAFGQHLARLVQESLSESHGSGDYRGPFIATLNERLRDYAEFDFGDEGPSYACLLYLGEKASAAMAATDNRWVLERMVDVEAPALYKHIKRLVHEVLGLPIN
jgi:hypothetical protein